MIIDTTATTTTTNNNNNNDKNNENWLHYEQTKKIFFSIACNRYCFRINIHFAITMSIKKTYANRNKN